VIGTGDPDQLFRFGRDGDCGFDRGNRSVRVAVAADEQLRLGAVAQESVVVIATLCVHGQAEGDEACDPRIVATGAQTDVRTKREAGKEDWPVKFSIQPVESGADIVLLAMPLIVLAFAEFGAAEVKTENGKAEVLNSLHGVVNDLVVHGASAERVRVADQSGVWGVGLADIEQGLEAACGPAKVNDGAKDGGANVRLWHRFLLYEGAVRYSGDSL
jgi:hypothetical protein